MKISYTSSINNMYIICDSQNFVKNKLNYVVRVSDLFGCFGSAQNSKISQEFGQFGDWGMPFSIE